MGRGIDKEMCMKIVFFGGSGFLGSHVCDKLSDAGHDVTIVDLRPSPYLRPDQKMVTGSLLDEDRSAPAGRAGHGRGHRHAHAAH